MTTKFCKLAANAMALFTLVKFWDILWETDNYTTLNWPDFIILMGCFLSIGTLLIYFTEEYPRFKLCVYYFNASFFTLAIGLLCFRINLFTISKICLLITSFLFACTFLAFGIAVIKTIFGIVNKMFSKPKNM